MRAEGSSDSGDGSATKSLPCEMKCMHYLHCFIHRRCFEMCPLRFGCTFICKIADLPSCWVTDSQTRWLCWRAETHKQPSESWLARCRPRLNLPTITPTSQLSPRGRCGDSGVEVNNARRLLSLQTQRKKEEAAHLEERAVRSGVTHYDLWFAGLHCRLN